MKSWFPYLDPPARRNRRLSSTAAALLSASTLALWAGCASSGDERAEQTAAEQRARFLNPERDALSPTPLENRAIEQENHPQTGE